MAKIKIPCLVSKDTAAGVRFYWQPSAALKRAGWTPLALGGGLGEAMSRAIARNREVEEWREGGARPVAVKRFVRRATVAALVAAYRADDRYLRLAPNTKATYDSALKLILEWATDRVAGDIAAAAITVERVDRLKRALMKPRADGTVQHHRAHNALRVGRTLFKFGAHKGLIEANPFVAFDLTAPDPRDQIWDYHDIAAFSAAARAIGWPGLAFAVELAEYTGQREEDLLKLQASQYREIFDLDPDQHRRVAGNDGRAMGIFIRQGKTKRWVGIPVAGAMRARVEMAVADNAARRPVASTTILVSDHSGRPWTKRFFIEKFNQAKQRAVDDGHAALADLQFRDLRRTCVVRLGELNLNDGQISAISGHRLGSIKKMLEVYMPRTNNMAAGAVVARLDHAARADRGRKQRTR